MSEALHAAWLAAPQHVATAVLVKGGNRYGIYEPRDSNRYAPDESTVINVEPVSYRYRQEGELWRFGFTADIHVLDENGTVRGSTEGAELGNSQIATWEEFTLTYTLQRTARYVCAVHEPALPVLRWADRVRN